MGCCMKYAIIENGAVINVAESDTALAPNWIQSGTAKRGDTYSNGVFTTPAPMPEPPAALDRIEQIIEILMANGTLNASDATIIKGRR